MRALGTYTLKGHWQAVTVVSVLSLLSLMMPLVGYFGCGVPLALIALRKGGRFALQVIAGSVVLFLLLSLVLGVPLYFLQGVLLIAWLPVFLCALVHRLTERPAMMALAAAALALLYVLVMYIAVGDVQAWWLEALQSIDVSELPAELQAQFEQFVKLAPPVVNAAIASSIVVSLIITLLLARWWQSALFNPGGFQREFHEFRVPRQLVLPTLALMGLSLLQAQPFTPVVRESLVVFVVLYLFHGIAAVHRTVARRRLSVNWLIAMYCLLFVLPQLMVLMVAWMGLTDSLIGRGLENRQDPED